MREAIYNKSRNELQLWDSKNTQTWIYCGSIKNAKILIEKTGVDQTLIIN